ncbi:MAG: extracellular solute-binding protein [Pseudoflavonifractor sp.]
MKKLVSLILSMAMVLSLASCATKVSPEQGDSSTGGKPTASVAPAPEVTKEPAGMQPVSEPVTITAWYTFGNANETNFLAAIDAFNSSQAFIKVEATQQTWNEINAKIMASLTAHTQPDLIFCSSAADVNNYVDMDVAVDLTPYVEDATIGIADFDDFNASAVSECTQWDGHMYMMPLSRTGEVMYYNADFFDENGLTPPATWAELQTLCEKITEITGKEALGSDYLDENYVDMVTQMGGSFIDYANKTACFDSEESRKALGYLKGLQSSGCLRLKGDDSNLLTPFAANLIQVVLGTSANYAKLFSQYGVGFNVGVCQIPTIENTASDYVTMWGVNAVVLKSEALRQQAAYEFLKFWTSTEQQATWAIGYDAMPVRSSAIASDAYQTYLKTALSTSVLVDEYDRLGYQPAATGATDATNAITACIDELLLGTLSMDDAIAQYKSDADAALQQ